MNHILIIKRFRKVENFVMFMLIWMCVVSFHSSFRRSEVSLSVDTLNKRFPEIDTVPRMDRAPYDVGANGTKHRSLNRTELSKLVNEEIKIQKENLRKNALKSKESEKKTKKKDADKKPDNKNTKYSSVAIKWFRERPVRDRPSGVPKKNEHLKNYILNPHKLTCNNENIDILIYFHSRPGDFEKRENLRKTWAATDIFKDLNVRTIFLLGKAETERQAKAIIIESNRYNDIVQGDFVESFHNLSLKVLMMLDWIYNYCPQAQYIVKSDDDMFVNPFILVERFISKIWTKKRVVMCHVKEEALVIKDKSSRWYIPTDILINDVVLPRHCSGYVTIFTGELIPEIYMSSADQPYVEVDDVYLFGFLLGDVAFVEYINIQDDLTLNQKIGMDEYKSNKADKHMAVSAWGKETLDLLWKDTIRFLSPLGKQIVNAKYLK